MSQPTVIVCKCSQARVVAAEAVEVVLRELADRHVPCQVVDDLCRLAGRRSEALACLATAKRPVIAACFPRAVKWLFAAGGAQLDVERAKFVNMRSGDLGGLRQELREAIGDDRPAEHPAAQAADDKPAADPWIPWFPVIDRDRCVNCKQCLNFCLFGVYGLSSDGQVEVVAPDKCKTFCPACARVCPEAAIVFPKYKTAPINGDQVRPEDIQREKMQTDVKAMLAQRNVYKALRERGGPSGPPDKDTGGTPVLPK